METKSTAVETAVSAAVPTSRPGGLPAKAGAAVEEGIPAETRRGYAGDWPRFTAWCASTGRQALPATGDTLTEYMTHLKGENKSPSTMDRALASITVAHAAAEIPKPSTVGARRVLKGHEAERKKSKDARRRPPPSGHRHPARAQEDDRRHRHRHHERPPRRRRPAAGLRPGRPPLRTAAARLG